MFGKKYESQVEIEKTKAQKELTLAMMENCDQSSLKPVVTDTGKTALIQIGAIKTVTQEESGWFYSDPERDSLLIRFLDGTWERLDMTAKDFVRQTGFGTANQ